jgi:hypothetical protein
MAFIGSWTRSESEDLLVNFLVKESVYKEFMLTMAEQGMSYQLLIEEEEPQKYIIAAFTWGDERRDRDFWKEINNKWVRFYIGFTYDIEVPFVI